MEFERRITLTYEPEYERIASDVLAVVKASETVMIGGRPCKVSERAVGRFCFSDVNPAETLARLEDEAKNRLTRTLREIADLISAAQASGFEVEVEVESEDC